MQNPTKHTLWGRDEYLSLLAVLSGWVLFFVGLSHLTFTVCIFGLIFTGGVGFYSLGDRRIGRTWYSRELPWWKRQ